MGFYSGRLRDTIRSISLQTTTFFIFGHRTQSTVSLAEERICWRRCFLITLSGQDLLIYDADGIAENTRIEALSILTDSNVKYTCVNFENDPNSVIDTNQGVLLCELPTGLTIGEKLTFGTVVNGIASYDMENWQFPQSEEEGVIVVMAPPIISLGADWNFGNNQVWSGNSLTLTIYPQTAIKEGSIPFHVTGSYDSDGITIECEEAIFDSTTEYQDVECHVTVPAGASHDGTEVELTFEFDAGEDSDKYEMSSNVYAVVYPAVTVSMTTEDTSPLHFVGSTLTVTIELSELPYWALQFYVCGKETHAPFTTFACDDTSIVTFGAEDTKIEIELSLNVDVATLAGSEFLIYPMIVERNTDIVEAYDLTKAGIHIAIAAKARFDVKPLTGTIQRRAPFEITIAPHGTKPFGKYNVHAAVTGAGGSVDDEMVTFIANRYNERIFTYTPPAHFQHLDKATVSFTIEDVDGIGQFNEIEETVVLTLDARVDVIIRDVPEILVPLQAYTLTVDIQYVPVDSEIVTVNVGAQNGKFGNGGPSSTLTYTAGTGSKRTFTFTPALVSSGDVTFTFSVSSPGAKTKFYLPIESITIPLQPVADIYITSPVWIEASGTRDVTIEVERVPTSSQGTLTIGVTANNGSKVNTASFAFSKSTSSTMATFILSAPNQSTGSITLTFTCTGTAISFYLCPTPVTVPLMPAYHSLKWTVTPSTLPITALPSSVILFSIAPATAPPTGGGATVTVVPYLNGINVPQAAALNYVDTTSQPYSLTVPSDAVAGSALTFQLL